jgi:predicted transcriptional regulator
MADDGRRAPGSLERGVLAILAAEGTALTPEQVRQELGGGLAYTTVNTVLMRLYDKGLVRRERVGRGYAYIRVSDGVTLTARRMGQLLDTVDDHAGVLSRFVDALSPDDERLLAALLRRAHRYG